MIERARIVLAEALHLAPKYPDLISIEVREVHEKGGRRPGPIVVLVLRELTPYCPTERCVQKSWPEFELQSMSVDLIRYAVRTVFEQLQQPSDTGCFVGPPRPFDPK